MITRAHLWVAIPLLCGCEGSPAALDAGADTGLNVDRDAGADAAPDASSDAGVDAGRPPNCEVPGDAGPVSRPDAGPAAPAPALDCGPVVFTEGTGLRRHPYLQSVTGTSARVAWTSTSGGAGLVRWAASPAGPWTEVAASAETFDVARTEDTTDYVAFDALIDGLEANRAYCYEVREDGALVASGLTLDTAWTGAERPLRILAFGDSGSGDPEQLALRDQMMTEEHDIFLHLGDIAYPDGTFSQFESYFFDVYRDLMHRIPTFPVLGNHEYLTDAGQPFLDVYYLFEQALRPQDQERYYSFDYGNVHFIALDSNESMLVPIYADTRGRITNDMIDWLVADLASSDAPWKVALFHHPIYSSGIHGPAPLVNSEILPALEEGGVDLVLVGHDHHYERIVPIRGGCFSDEQTGITSVVAGGGGASLRDIVRPDNWYTVTYNDQVHSYLSLTIHGCVATGRALDASGNELDAWSLNGCD